METLPVKPERLAPLEEFARRGGKSTADALDDALADDLEWERQDYQEAVKRIRSCAASAGISRSESLDRMAYTTYSVMI
ncbi:MAG: hypothetical protein ACRD26_14990 [Vicinamibacterales bacterium]